MVNYDDLRQRYEQGDPSLTDDEVTRLRLGTGSLEWSQMLERKQARENVVRFNAPMNDADRAKDIRDRMTEVLGEIVDIMDDAKEHGLRVGFQLSQPDAFGRHHVVMLEILKEL